MSEDCSELHEILSTSRTIAVLGMKTDPACDAHRIPKYMQEHGYRILPVNPKADEVLGESAANTLADLGEPVDVVNIFRAAEHLPAHADEILAMSPPPRAVWMQLGIHHGPTAAKLRAAGIQVVQDRCIMVEHKRLMSQEGDDRAA